MILRCLRRLTDASAPPKSARTRCRTSTTAKTPSSRHTRSSSPPLQRTLRASTTSPRVCRYSAASCSDAAPRCSGELEDTIARLRGRGITVSRDMFPVHGNIGGWKMATSLLAEWDNFYVITGSAAAGLTGLTFVVIALAADANRVDARGLHAYVT